MVTFLDWENEVLQQADAQSCPKCGQEERPFMVLEDGELWAHCRKCDRSFLCGAVKVPAEFDLDPDGFFLPF